MIPNAERDFQKLVPRSFGVFDCRTLSAQLHPPQISAACSDFMIARLGLYFRSVLRLGTDKRRKRLVGFIYVCPFGRNKRYFSVGFARLKQNAHTHGFFVRRFGTDSLAEFGMSLAPDAMLCVG